MISKKIHYSQPWKVHEIATDFTLWDVWEFPIRADNSKTENFQSFYKIYLKGIKKAVTSKTFAGFLFSLRNLLGYIFPFDKNINTLPIPGCTETSVKARLTDKDFKKSKEIYSLDPEIFFSPVYLFENESLYEFSNDTVHGLAHLGWIKKKDEYYTATMAIYIKPRGIFGRSYLKLIEPFRHLFVYPVMMEMVASEWEKYVSESNQKSGKQDENNKDK